jgi:NDP-sugar pyrophosphorylase family protein/tRNA A-37 threonylcarbamoyl transferase component Bud32
MKGFILAAGLGTRLDPYTQKIPKPLFTLASKPIIAYAIDALVNAGCSDIIINSHHLHDQIRAFADAYPANARITVLHEPQILDTGGGIANAKPYLSDAPFFVVNADVISTIDLANVYRHHLSSGKLATLVLHDCKRFNKVGTDDDGCITGFNKTSDALAFTGIQVLSPDIFDYFPAADSFSSIDVYTVLCAQKQVGSIIDKTLFWSDIGTPDTYIHTSIQVLCARYFGLDLSEIPQIIIRPLAGDGSDRRWYRAVHKDRSVIIASHGICLPCTDQDRECRAFINIGRHLNTKHLHAPTIYEADPLSGVVLAQDLGDDMLQAIVREHPEKGGRIYKRVIDHLISFSQKGVDHFDPGWTCQTPEYSKELILDKECRYFIDAFINGYLGLGACYDDYRTEFEQIADRALQYAIPGLMHRDLQSRNIMIHNDHPWFIDFQSARIGPIQYDLASLLIDPYVDLDSECKKTLLGYALKALDISAASHKQQFVQSYTACCVTRNLQALGAYGHLTCVKRKKTFEQYIPCAVKSLKTNIREYGPETIPKLTRLISGLKGDQTKEWKK